MESSSSRKVRPRSSLQKYIKVIYKKASQNVETSNEYIDNISGDTEQILSLMDPEAKRRKCYEDHALGRNLHQRPDISGYQRATIYFSKLSIDELSKAHHCHPSTIRRIQSDPLAACGISLRHCKKFLNDMKQSNYIKFYTETSSILKRLPPLPEIYRSGPKSKITELHKSWIRCLLEAYPDLYLDELISFLVFFDPGLVCSISTLSRCLKKMGYSRKSPNRVLQRADSAEIEYFRSKFTQLNLRSGQLVFLDEACNARACGIRTKSRAPKGITPLGTSHSTGMRMTLCCGISVQGVLNGSLFQGGLNTSNFEEILNEQILPSMNPFPCEKSVLILDNCKAHSINPIEIWEKNKILVLFLPPYSPHLNPIERYFSVCKALIRRLVYTNKELRGNPVALWQKAILSSQSTFNFRKVIESVYQPDPKTGIVSIQL